MGRLRILINSIQGYLSQHLGNCPKCNQSKLTKHKVSYASSSPWQHGLEIETQSCTTCGYSAEIRLPLSPMEQFPPKSSPPTKQASYPGGASAGCGGCG